MKRRSKKNRPKVIDQDLTADEWERARKIARSLNARAHRRDRVSQNAKSRLKTVKAFRGALAAAEKDSVPGLALERAAMIAALRKHIVALQGPVDAKSKRRGSPIEGVRYLAGVVRHHPGFDSPLKIRDKIADLLEIDPDAVKKIALRAGIDLTPLPTEK